jgi:hypothetical protein
MGDGFGGKICSISGFFMAIVGFVIACEYNMWFETITLLYPLDG